jgi:hypothetical protein
MVRAIKILILCLLTVSGFTQVVQERNARGADRIIILKDGFRVPIRDTATAPALLNYSGDSSRGGVVYDSTLQKLCFWTGVRWVCLDDSATGGSIDTTSLSNRINLKLNISDTATMNANFLVGIGAGTNVTVDNTNPRFPIVSATGGGGGGAPIDSVYIAYNTSANSVYSRNGGTGGGASFQRNVGIGLNTLAALNGVAASNLRGSRNIAIGADALSTMPLTTSGTGTFNNIGIGDSAMALNNSATSADNIAIGTNSYKGGVSSFNVAIGTRALQNVTGTGNNGNRNIAIGHEAGANVSGNHTLGISIGHQALAINNAIYIGSPGTGTTSNRIIIGNGAFSTASSVGLETIGIGANACTSCTGARITAIGHGAAPAHTTATDATFIGRNAGTGSTGAGSVMLGHGTKNGTGQFNISVGQDAGATTTTGARNIMIGYLANSNASVGSIITSGAGNIGLGGRSSFPSATASNQFVMMMNGSTDAVSYNVLTRFTGGQWLMTGPGQTAYISTATTSAALEIRSVTAGFLPPVMTGNQAQAISSKAAGLMVYTTAAATSGLPDAVGWWGWNGSAWEKLNN